MHQTVQPKQHICYQCKADATTKGWYCLCVPCRLKMDDVIKDAKPVDNLVPEVEEGDAKQG